AAARGAGAVGGDVGPAAATATQPTALRAAPAARALAKELGVDLSLVTGTGPEGRIKVEDVRAFAAQTAATTQASPSTPVARRVAQDLGVDVGSLRGSGPAGRVTGADVVAWADKQSSAGAVAEDDWLDLTPGQKVTGERMLASVQTAPQFALSLSADMTAALALREAYGTRRAPRPSITAILVKVVAAALRQHPRVNASFVQGRLRLHKRISIGVAVGTEQGLVVPVIADADRRSLAEVAAAVEALQEKARIMRFAGDDLAGGTFTISNLGMYGIERFTAIVNPPEAAILAVGAIVRTPVVADDGTVTVRPLLSLTLSVDHRALDGLQGAQFLADVKALLENPALAL
ncbi:MAG: 2-oxo acid dehydrogenase subunit E2, partial [Anaerolineae bacterium]